MSEEKSAVLQAMKKMKRANKKIADSEQAKTSGGKNRKNDDDDESIVDSIINAVSNLKDRD